MDKRGLYDTECLVIMPFGSLPGEKLLNNMVYDHIILEACKKAGVQAGRIDRQYVGNQPISEWLERNLKIAPLVIADLTGNNANVLFELGFRRAQRGKPFICISRGPGEPAFWAKVFEILDCTEPGAMDLLAHHIAAARRDINRSLEVEEKLYKLQDTIRKPESFGNPFQDCVSAWRISRAIEDVERIQNAEWELEAKTSASYVSYMLVELLNVMRDGDEYLTVSNIEFWASESVSDAAFLKANITAAVRGVVVKRVLLIDRRRCDDLQYREEVKRVAKRQADAVAKSERRGTDRFVVRFRLIEDYEDQRRRYGHFAIARRPSPDPFDAGSMMIEPRYEQPLVGEGITQLRLLFPMQGSEAQNRVAERLSEFEELFHSAPNIEELAKIWPAS